MQNDNDISELMQLKSEVESILARIANLIARRSAVSQAQAQVQPVAPSGHYMSMPPAGMPQAPVPQPIGQPQYSVPQYQPQQINQAAYQIPVQPNIPQQVYAPQTPVPAPLPQAPQTVPVAAPIAPVLSVPQMVPAGHPAPVHPMPAATNLPADLPPIVQAMIQIMRNYGRIMSFDQLYERLLAEKVALPADKPMLVIRRHLFNKAYFHAEKDRYWPAMDPHP